MESVVYLAEDFQDLPFDVSKHAEALRSFAILNLLPVSIKPALRARELIFIRFPSCKFRIGVTNNPNPHKGTAGNVGRIAFEIICQADNPTEAAQVCGEVERYFLRHYPGRFLHHVKEAEQEILSSKYVYVACYAPGE